ncbi:chemokine-like protein orion isoform X1 [Lycorma delicatula]|uniref:chemokine-like protein orion isoform X1 n=1 Tax=Lycorma delicatula TaxID=130591 RepID=UPI003F50DD5E
MMRSGRSALFLLTIISFGNIETISVSISDFTDLYEFTRELVTDIAKTWDIVGPTVMEKHLTPPILQAKGKKLMDRMMVLTKSINHIEERITISTSITFGNLQYDLPKVIRYELKLDDLLSKTAMIESADHNFQDYLQASVNATKTNNTNSDDSLHFERHTLENFATYVVSHHPESVLGLMEQIHYLVAPETWQHSMFVNQGGILNQIKETLQEIGSNLCNVQQSPQQVIYNIYTSLQMTQLKGYTMMQFSWMLLRLYNKGNFTLEANKSKEKYLHRMRLQVQMAKKAMSDADQSMWRCDPYKYVEDETYTQLTRLLQGYIQNEIDLNNEETCRENCQYYSYTKQFGCYKDNFCSQQRNCNGRIVDCKFIDSDMTVCQAETMSNERYRWIEYKNGEKLGDLSQSCARVTKVDSWWRYLFWHCSYCLCICDDPYFSDRYFNLRPVTSNVEENMVVTAIRFIKVDHIIHLQIQEGKMLPKGIINETTLSWRPVDEYKIDITGVRNKDYHMMSWEERGIDLDELTAPQNHVLTGVKFRKLGTHLNLEIRITPFNFSNGLLIKPKEKSEWISNDNTDGASESPRTEVKLKAPDVPTKHPFNNRPDSQKDQFLIFTYTDIYKDIAQHTVPYIDTQIVGPQPPTPLSGVGLMHKGMDGSGGFISPKVFTYNMAPHLQEDFEEI